MCNVIVQETVVISPHGVRTVTVLYDGPGGMWEETWTDLAFTGCATSEIEKWWRKQGDEIVVPARLYGEKNKSTKAQGWGRVPEGMGVKAIALKAKLGKNYREMKVFTRDGGEEALRKFGNDRVPLFVSLKDGKPPEVQPELIISEAPEGWTPPAKPKRERKKDSATPEPDLFD